MSASTSLKVKPSRETVAEAAAWITRLHSSRRTPEVEAAFRSWLSANPERATAFEGMTEIWEAMPGMQMGEFSLIAPNERKSKQAGIGMLVRAAAVVGVCAAAGLAAYGYFRDPMYVTSIGEQRIVNLKDGTRVSLNSATRMSVQYSDLERRIVLKEGEAFFEVTHHPRRPFVVVAGGNRVTALGTSFAVRYEGDSTAVTLVDGRVAVVPATTRATSNEPVEPVRTLKPGERWVVDREGAERVDTPRVEAVTAWRRGEVILDETILADAVAEMNRYDETPLVIDDPTIAALPVSGIYRTGDSPGFAIIVARMYGLTVARQDGRIHLQGPPKTIP